MAWYVMAVMLLLANVVRGQHAAESAGDEDSALPLVADRIRGLEHRDGFLPLYVDDDQGTVLAEISRDGRSFIYATGLSSGLGSNPVGLDRGQWGRSRIARFHRVGKRVYLIEANLRYRASAGDAAERKAVSESFADSVLWSGDVVAVSDETLLVDLKSLLLRDAHSVTRTLKESEQGDYRFSQDLSFVELDRCRAFPKNTELNALVTFTSERAGLLVDGAAADGTSFSLRMHHSFVQLPEPGYQPRAADPRVASIEITFADYSAPLDRPLEQRWITRHRLQKADPSLAVSPPVEPIVYYLDPGTPQPVRDALLDGARWWNAAFEAAGFSDAFQVQILPEDADPMDVRYNVIQWVHRRTRGWSYGQSVIDPRTGEIIKGHVLLGSLRVRQDRMIIDGLTSAANASPPGLCSCCGIAGTGCDETLALFDPQLSPIDVSLARLRQLSAHEVGHTIGFAHNFAASTYGDRESVMDYPAPRVTITADGDLDLSDAYGVGVGAWDTFMVRYAYTEFSGREVEAHGLEDLIAEARRNGLLYLSDADARPAGAANPVANLWDNGSDPVEELRHLMRVRELALTRLNEGDLLPGQPVSDLAVVFVPVYLYHRYQIDAVAKVIGGFHYDYAMAGAAWQPVQPIAVAEQKQALDALLDTLRPEQLEIPSDILQRLSPPAWRSASDVERFESRTAMIFDPDSAVRTAADLTIAAILEPERVARLDAYGDETWNLKTVLDRMHARLMQMPSNTRSARMHHIVQSAYVQRLIALAGDESTSHAVRAAATEHLNQLSAQLTDQQTRISDRGHTRQMVDEIRRFLDRPHQPASRPQSPDVPPGSPIGTEEP